MAPAQKTTTRQSKSSVKPAGSKSWGTATGATRSSTPANAEPGEPAHGGEQQVLRRELAHEAPAIRAEHGADRELVAASSVARQQQVRDVREADQEHEADHAEKEQRRALELRAEHDVAQRLERHAAAFVRFGILASEVRRDSLELFASRVERNAGLEARHGLKHVAAARALPELPE